MKSVQIHIKLLFVITLALTIISCEKVVELDLDDENQMLVVEGIVHDSIGDNFVLLSKSKPFNDNSGGFQTVSGAEVIVRDDLGNTFVLTERNAGFYKNDSLKGTTGRTYFLTVRTGEKVVTAQSSMGWRVNLDSLSYEKIDSPFGGSNEDEPNEYSVFTHFFDTPIIKNFYRIKAFVKGVQEKGFIVLDDNLIEGDSVVFPIFQTRFLEKDTVTVQLLSIDEKNYRYFNAIAASQNGEVPGNPETNLVGKNVVGYFGAYAKSERKIVMNPLP